MLFRSARSRSLVSTCPIRLSFSVSSHPRLALADSYAETSHRADRTRSISRARTQRSLSREDYTIHKLGVASQKQGESRCDLLAGKLLGRSFVGGKIRSIRRTQERKKETRVKKNGKKESPRARYFYIIPMCEICGAVGTCTSVLRRDFLGRDGKIGDDRARLAEQIAGERSRAVEINEELNK